MSEADRIDEELEELFSLDGPGPARRQPAAANAALIAAALDAWQAAPPLDPGTSSPSTASNAAGASAPWAKVAMLAAAIGAVVGAAVAIAILWGSTEAPRAPEPAPTPEVPIDAVPTPTEATVAPPAELVPALEDEAPAPVREPARARRAAPPPAERPEDLIARGNALRAERRWSEAEQAYLSASRASPRSSIAHVADVAAAAIRLEHRGDPTGAATLYARALAARPNGPLALEAREGIARAERRRGRGPAERAALEAILTHHPGSPAATRARARLLELAP